MTTDPRSYTFPADAFIDVLHHELFLIVNLSESWGASLIYDLRNADDETRRLWSRMGELGEARIELTQPEVDQLRRGAAIQVDASDGQRYLFVVADVEELEDLLEERDRY